MRLAGQAKGGFYPTPPRVADMIAEGVRMPPHTQRKGRAGETLRILDPCCGKGEAAGRLADGIREWDDRSVETFGIELHRERAQEARRRMTRVLSVDMFQTQIANRAFGMLFLNPHRTIVRRLMRYGIPNLVRRYLEQRTWVNQLSSKRKQRVKVACW